MREVRFEVDDAFAGKRLDKALSELIPEKSRMQLKAMLKDGAILIDGRPQKPSYTLKEGETIIAKIPSEKTIDLSHVPMDLLIRHEDEWLLVVEKPSGLITHPSPTTEDDTLLHGLLDRIDKTAFKDPTRAGVVHRLDKDTSGLLLFAKDESTLSKLQAMLKKRTISRKYLALTDGVIDHNRGKIDAPIGRHPKKRHLMSVVAGGKESVTHFSVLERFENSTFIECDLETGRTHQIRVHLQYIEKPVLGDTVYGKRKQNDPFGQYLHAYQLTFTHPVTNREMTFESDLPKPFQDKLEALRQR